MALLDPKNAVVDLERKDRGGYVPDAFEQIGGLTVAKSLNRPMHAMKAVVSVTGNAVRWRADGTDPDSGTGCRINQDSTQIFTGATAMDLTRFIGEDGTAIMNVQYYR